MRKQTAREAMYGLVEKLMDKKVVDVEILTCVDRVMRRLYTDIDPGWIRWSFYIETNLFAGDHKKYDAWAKENCQ